MQLVCQLHVGQMLHTCENRGLPACFAPLPAARRDPIVLPFYHSGMGRVLPRHGRLPRAGHSVAVVVGQPVDLADLTCR